MNRRRLTVLLLGLSASMGVLAADEWLSALPDPAPLRDADPAIDKARQDALAARLRQVLALRQFATLDELRFFSVAADTPPAVVERTFQSAALERGAKAFPTEGIDLQRLGLSLFSMVEQGMMFKDRYGVAMANPDPGQDTVLVAYFKLG